MPSETHRPIVRTKTETSRGQAQTLKCNIMGSRAENIRGPSWARLDPSHVVGASGGQAFRGGLLGFGAARGFKLQRFTMFGLLAATATL